jgi:twitching motility protein PilI
MQVPQLQESLLRRAGASKGLAIRLDERTVAILPLESLRDVARISASHIATVPNMPDCVMGVTNRRGKVIWCVDLPYFMGYQRLERRRREQILISIAGEKRTIAFAVADLDGLWRYEEADLISAPSEVAPHLVPYLRGCLQTPDMSLLALEPKALADSSAFRPK